MDDSKIVELYLSRNESAISQTAQKYGLKLRRMGQLEIYNRLGKHVEWMIMRGLTMIPNLRIHAYRLYFQFLF